MSGTVLVTGAAGFVGSAVTRRVARDIGERTLRFDDGSPVTHVVAMVSPGASLVRLEAALQSPSHCSVGYCDFADPAALRSVVERWRPRCVMHLAIDRSAYTDESDALRRRVIDAPLEGLFAGLAGERGARIVFTSSAWVLPSGDRLGEDTPPKPFTIYGRNKLRAEQQLPVLHARTGVDWINLRLFNIFGRYESPYRLLPYLVERLSHGQIATLGNGDAVRDFTDVDVLAGAYAAALAAAPTACGASYHIGSGRAITIRELAMTAADVIGRRDLLRFEPRATPDGEIPCQVANPELARKILGWSVATDVRADIRSVTRCLLEAAKARPTGEVQV